MRIARFAAAGEVAYGVVGEAGENGSHGGPGPAGELMIAELVGHPFGGGPGSARFTGASHPVSAVRLLAPVLPSKVVAVGGNYAGHPHEVGDGPAAEPVLFLKPSTAVCGHGDRITYPAKLTQQVDCGGTLAVVIGRLCRDVPAARAAAAVFGYTCANDVTARDLLARDGQWARAKGFDTFCPLGPWIETEADPAGPAGLELTTTVSGEVRQRASTSGLLHDVPALIAYASSVMTLLPGDVLLTGTPAGAGPLADGDEVSVTIEGIGTLTNEVTSRD